MKASADATKEIANSAPAPERDSSCELARFERNFLAEEDSVVLYEALAAFARNAHEERVYKRLAASERRHASYWRGRLCAAGASPPEHSTSPRTRLLIHLARWLGSGFVVPIITAREVADDEDYAEQSDAATAGLPAEERGHAEVLRGMIGAAVGTNLRAAVLGASDGLASNFCLMMGVIGGGAEVSTVLLAALAGLLGGAFSMALGEWLSVTNARELTDSLMDREVRARDRSPMLEGHKSASYEAWSAARFSFSFFALGAAVPLVPFVAIDRNLAVAGSIVLSISAFFCLGLVTSLFNGRSPGFSALRQTGIGAAAALVTYAGGRLFSILSG